MIAYTIPPYFGGKNTHRPGGVGKWIVSMLPYKKDSAYIEPFAGMLGILTARLTADIEIVSDLNGRVANWWKCVRDCRDELMFRLTYQGPCEELFHEYKSSLDEGDPVDRAAKFYHVITQSRMKGDGESGWSGRYVPRGRPFFSTERLIDGLESLADRLRYVQVLNRPAEFILERVAHLPHTMIYADPPYSTADTTSYGVDNIDKPALIELFKAQQGQVAISGYNDEWDELGWERHEFDTYVSSSDADATPHRKSKRVVERTEVLWTNYTAGSQLELIDE